MYVVKVYEEDNGGYLYVGQIKGKFLTYEDAKIKIENQNLWCKHKFYFRIDNILISKNLRSYNCTVDRSIRESDHYPIWCYIAKRQ